MSPSDEFSVALRFHGDLTFFLKKPKAGPNVTRLLREKTSVKDVIESCGVPHPEVDLILHDEVPIDFRFQLAHDSLLDVYPPSIPADFHADRRLQRRAERRFVLDGHLGTLARNLRLLGIDSAYSNDADDLSLLRIASEERRVLLTRDRRLLMRAVIHSGYCPRSDLPEEQTIEVLRRFDLVSVIQPYTRCLRCNGFLEPVEKDAVSTQLEPLTKIYCADFRRCGDCARVYWPGSHFARLEDRIARLRSAVILKPQVDC